MIQIDPDEQLVLGFVFLQNSQGKRKFVLREVLHYLLLVGHEGSNLYRVQTTSLLKIMFRAGWRYSRLHLFLLVLVLQQISELILGKVIWKNWLNPKTPSTISCSRKRQTQRARSHLSFLAFVC
eukprot:Lithocolla_globosa_v1_NODE_578_length_3693_cov_3.312259.p3 type:complete len:124 gc:universal NODE_578_length_3693_cov_3.312259:1084-1455(+)